MTETDPFDPLRHARPPGVAAPRTLECLDDDTMAALASGTLDPGTRLLAIAHAADCGYCRGGVAAVARALADLEVRREVEVLDRGFRQRRFSRIAIPLAAAATLALAVAVSRWTAVAGHRAPTISGAEAPVQVQPAGPVTEVRRLQWTSVGRADRYRVTLFDIGGQVVYEAQLTDTIATLPDAVVLGRGERYLWKVEARTGFDRWVTSKLVEFSMTGGPPR